MRLKQAKLLTGLPGRPNTHMRRLGAPGVGDGTSRVANVSGLPGEEKCGQCATQEGVKPTTQCYSWGRKWRGMDSHSGECEWLLPFPPTQHLTWLREHPATVSGAGGSFPPPLHAAV